MPLQTLPELADQAEALERIGDWSLAGRTYANLFRSAVDAQDCCAIADSLRGEARVLRHQGRWEAARELAELSWEVAERNELPQEAARAVNTVATIRYDQQDWTGAQHLYEGALERARDLGDDELIGLVCQNLGVIANMLGNLAEARALYLESIASSVRSGAGASAMMAYNNLGMVCADLQEWMEAELYFDRGIEIADQIGNATLLALLYTNRAEPLIHVRELDRARESLRFAEEIAIRIGDHGTLADAARFRGVIARLEGDLPTADVHLAQALAFATEADLDLERAETLEELAQLRWERGCTEEARTALQEAHQGFLTLGAKRDVARVEKLFARWGSDHKDLRWLRRGRLSS